MKCIVTVDDDDDLGEVVLVGDLVEVDEAEDEAEVEVVLVGEEQGIKMTWIYVIGDYTFFRFTLLIVYYGHG